MNKIKPKHMNQLRAFYVLTKYSFLASVRNPATVFFGIVFPLIFILVFGLLNSNDRTYDLGVVKGSVKNGPVYESLKKIEAIELVGDKTDAELKDELKKGKIPAIIDIQEKDLGQGNKQYNVDLQLTDADPQNGQVITSIVSSIVDQLNRGASPDEATLANISESKIKGRKYKAIDFVLPGQLAFALFSSGVFGLAFTFLSLRQRLVIKRIFATPVKKWVFIAAEVISRTGVALLQSTIIILVGVFLFGFTLANGVWTFLALLVLSFVALLMAFGIGFSISSVANDENTIPPLANLITLPQFLMAGTFFPIEVFPEWLQPIARIMPLRFVTEAMRLVSFEGASLLDVWKEIAAIIIWSAIIYAITIKVFRWE